jgi:CHAT domain-containing protein
MEKPQIDISSAALYGGLIYDVTENDMLAQSRVYAKEHGEIATRGFVADSTMRAGWKYLDGSRNEVEAIADMCQSQNIETKVYTSIAGNEESFKALSGRKIPIIHLATHGFFYKNEEVENKPFFESMHLREQQIRQDNSVKRSGLILASAQKAWLGEPIPDEVEDGILLAEEIAAMDLTGTDLVVLSACETGLGEITSEGVFGLQRAFKKAGVQTLIMSLWKVDDTATSLFMQTFYGHWLGGKTKHEAFTLAQDMVRTDDRFSNPFYWAGFIMLD